MWAVVEMPFLKRHSGGPFFVLRVQVTHSGGDRTNVISMGAYSDANEQVFQLFDLYYSVL